MIILCGNEVSKVKTWMFLTSPKGVLSSHPLLPRSFTKRSCIHKEVYFFGGGGAVGKGWAFWKHSPPGNNDQKVRYQLICTRLNSMKRIQLIKAVGRDHECRMKGNSVLRPLGR